MLVERTDFSITTTRVVCDVNWNGIALGTLHSTADSAKGVKIMIDGGYTQLHRIQVLIGEIDISKHIVEQFSLLRYRARSSIGEAFTVRVGVGKLRFIIPAS